MKTEKTLREKLNEAEVNLSGVSKQLEPYERAVDRHRNGSIEDVEYLETDLYQIVAAKWEEHNWSLYEGAVQWEEWLSLHYRRKGYDGKIKQLKTEKIVTRNRYDPKKDKTYLWSHDFVSIQSLGPSKIEIAWVDEAGNKGPIYELDLE